MSTQQQVLAAIRADPESDAPRLVYADWLDENGDPARAEFVRVGCALARAADARDAAEFPLRRRAWLLEAEHGDRWRAELPADRRVRWSGFRRGFRDWLTVWQPLGESPLPEGIGRAVFDTLVLHLGGGPAPTAEVALLEDIRSLWVRARPGPRGSAQLNWLIASGVVDPLTRVRCEVQMPASAWRSLTRPRSGVAWEELTLQMIADPADIAGLADLGAPLRRLELGFLPSRALASPGLDRLAAGLPLREYEQCGGMLTPADAAALCRGGVQWLSLRNVAHDRTSWETLARGLEPGLRGLKIWNESLPSGSWELLLSNPRLTGLESLELGGRSRSRLPAEWLARAAFAGSLRRLSVSLSDGPNPPGWLGWAGDGVRAGRLLSLDLAIPLSDAGLAELLRPGDAPVPLAGLRQFRAGLTDASADSLRRATHLTGLQRLALSHCAIGEASARALAESPQFANLCSLDISGTTGGPGVRRALLESHVLGRYMQLDAISTPGLDGPAVGERFPRWRM